MARNLRRASVDMTAIRDDGTIHDFVMLNALANTNTAKAVTAQAGAFLREALHGNATRRCRHNRHRPNAHGHAAN